MGYPFVISLCLALLSARSSPPAAEIKVDQVGYPQGPKLAMVVSEARPFTVRDEASQAVFQRPLAPPAYGLAFPLANVLLPAGSR